VVNTKQYCITGPWALRAAVIGIIALIMVATLVLASVPPVSRDALTHHLALPKLYLEQGLQQELPHILYSYFPMNLDLLYMVPLALDFDIGAKYIHCLFGLLTALLVYMQLKKWLGGFYGLLGVLLFLSLPAVLRLSISAYVDLGLTFFSAAALFSVIKWLEDGFKARHIVLAAVFCGLALGTKYNALILLCYMTLSIPLVGMAFQRRQGHADSLNKMRQIKPYSFLGLAGVFCLLALLIYAPWAVRNIIWTGNPIYPLYDSYVQKLNPHALTPSDNDRIRARYAQRINRDHFTARRMVFKETPLQIATIPFRIFFEGRDNDPRYFDGRLSPFLFFLPFLSFAGAQREGASVKIAKCYLFVFSWMYIVLVFLSTDMRIRYIAPALPPLVVLSICGLSNVTRYLGEIKNKRRLATALTIAFLMVVCISASTYINTLFHRYTPLQYLSGKIDRASYIERFWPEYDILRYANKNLPDKAKVLSVFGGNRRYYCDFDVFFNNDMFRQIIVSSATAGDIHRDLCGKGFSHLIIDYPLFRTWIFARLSNEQQNRVEAFFKTYTETLFADQRHALLAL